MVYHFMTVEGMALATGRHAVFNHALLNALFLHPNTDKNETFAMLSNSEVMAAERRMKKRTGRAYQDLNPCGKVAQNPFSTFADILFVHGCYGNNLLHPEARLPLAKAFGLEFAVKPGGLEIEPYYTDMMFSNLFQWTYSRPQPSYKRHVKERTRNITSLCHEHYLNKSRNNGNTVDVRGTGLVDYVVQIRTFRDVVGATSTEHFMGSEQMTTFRTCAFKAVMEAQSRVSESVISGNGNSNIKSDGKAPPMPICVYVTSDDPAVANHITQSLEDHEGFEGSVVSHSEIRDDWHKPKESLSLSLHDDKIDDWHSQSLMDRHKGAVGTDTELSARPEFLDWMVLSEATGALFTHGSTFGTSARYRKGYFNSIHDLGLDKDQKTNEFTCELAHDRDHLCEACTQLGDKCLSEAREVCARPKPSTPFTPPKPPDPSNTTTLVN